MSADGRHVWAVTRASSSLVLRVLDLPAPDAATILLSATPGAFYAGGSVQLDGGLMAVTGRPLAGEVLTVSRAATGAYPVALDRHDVRRGGLLVHRHPTGTRLVRVHRRARGGPRPGQHPGPGLVDGHGHGPQRLPGYPPGR